VALHLTCTGPLAAGTLAFGVTGGRDDAGQGEFHYGQDTNQESHSEGVWGERVGYCQYESPDAVEVDLSDEAHQKRRDAAASPAAGYYLIARYD